MTITLRTPHVPMFILDGLARRDFQYSKCKTIFHFVWLHGPENDPDKFTAVGVCGDGDNGAYEWFKWKRGELTSSNCGYGGTETALLHVLACEASL